MGWNEARVDIVPDGWQLTVEETDAKSASGENVRLIGTERVPEASADVLRADKLGRWLGELGFVINEKWAAGTNYIRDDILVGAYQEGNVVSSIMVQFTLTRDSPLRWKAWQQFIESLCSQWPAALGDSEQLMRVAPDQLFSLLSRTMAWRDFETNFGWPNPPGVFR